MPKDTNSSSHDATQLSQSLLLRILQQNLEDEKTRVSQPALDVIDEYVKTFIKEAMWRAAAQRKDSNKSDNVDMRGGCLFLEAEDLERLAPQLLLDF